MQAKVFKVKGLVGKFVVARAWLVKSFEKGGWEDNIFTAHWGFLMGVQFISCSPFVSLSPLPLTNGLDPKVLLSADMTHYTGPYVNTPHPVIWPWRFASAGCPFIHTARAIFCVHVRTSRLSQTWTRSLAYATQDFCVGAWSYSIWLLLKRILLSLVLNLCDGDQNALLSVAIQCFDTGLLLYVRPYIDKRIEFTETFGAITNLLVKFCHSSR